MKSILIITILAALSACVTATVDPAAAARRAEAEKKACKRSPYCQAYDPAGKTEDQREAELRDVREAVKASQQ
ncbi:hypothetical protein PEC18_18570 [Paucibacter sp. O1-1]|nr:hypothetical protein [Paucibacter sp. O1-1]MDA3827802.1 hypothetical protein [Paucibacter sp. O1-1]